MSRPFNIFLLSLWFVCGGQSATAAVAVWIDTDPACDLQRSHDVDDCWALTRALQAKELSVRGISTVFGNSSEAKGYDLVADLLDEIVEPEVRPSLFRGASHPYMAGANVVNESVAALATALKNERLTIISLGPLTNIATLIVRHPELAERIESLVVVAGQRPEQGARFHPGPSKLFHVHDFNFRKDVAAFQIILDADLPVTLVPFEAARNIKISDADLTTLSSKGFQGEFLAGLARPWLNYWLTTFGSDSFYPFDSLAVGFVIDSERFSCERLPVYIEPKPSLFLTSRDRLLVSEDYSGGMLVDYCFDVDSGFKADLLASLGG
ncbi:MAG: hypothetical protein DHS20C12_06320 [Pseudohongiella sp.]|nr:MAG: hypothetical protein DHS20C12_06320 [Pseudohongiella sp.]